MAIRLREYIGDTVRLNYSSPHHPDGDLALDYYHPRRLRSRYWICDHAKTIRLEGFLPRLVCLDDDHIWIGVDRISGQRVLSPGRSGVQDQGVVDRLIPSHYRVFPFDYIWLEGRRRTRRWRGRRAGRWGRRPQQTPGGCDSDHSHARGDREYQQQAHEPLVHVSEPHESTSIRLDSGSFESLDGRPHGRAKQCIRPDR
jgi:hypothetical protein